MTTECRVFELKNVSKRFNESFALDTINLSLLSGEVHVIIGENGSGKTALLRLLAGLYAPDSGKFFYNGQEQQFQGFSQARQLGIMYRPQEPQLFDNLSIAENLFFDHLPRNKLSGLDTIRLYDKTKKLLTELGITLNPQALAGTLGYAQRQLLEAAKACIGNNALVALDEPTASLAEPEREILFSIVRRLRESGASIVYVSHRLDEVLKIGDKVSVMRHGKIVDTIPIENIDKSSLVHRMTGELMTERYPRFTVPKGNALLEVQNLHSGHILRGVTFTLKKQEILGITGLMGSGRTRLAQCLFGAVEPSRGTILLDGKPVRFRSPQDALNRGIALVPEDRVENCILRSQDLVLNLTVASLRRFKKTTGLDSAHMFSLVKDYSDRIGLRPGKPGDYPEFYSGGNQQKVSVARWLAKRSRIYIFDEPTKGIDASSKVDVYNAISDMVSKGASVILVSSDMEEILGMCDRVLVLTGGKIVCDLPRDKVTQEQILEYATGEEE